MHQPRQLDVTVPQKVSYCIPEWLRDEQIKINMALIPGRVEETSVLYDEPIAIVCYGPSLNETWEQVRDFKYIMSCSGAHKFLIDRGIVPTWHTDVDPREHKIKLIGQPHPDVEYLLASTCHPKYFELLKNGGHKVRLWHVFDAKDEGLRLLPPGEWALTGGCSVGLRAMALSRFLGFREMHVFGMDGNEGTTGKHAAEHPNQQPGYDEVVYNGVTYRTTPSLLEAARETFHELDDLKDTNVTFHGNGLVQAMAKDYVRKDLGRPSLIAFIKPELISDQYKDLNAQLHRERLDYGVGGGKHANTVLSLVKSMKKELPSVLDYGCGKGYLGRALPFPIWEYDPAVPGKQDTPRPADLVVCTDVLEHIEPDKLNFVLNDLSRCTKQVGYFVIHIGPAIKTYANGENTHLIQQNTKWWEKQLKKHFTIGKIFDLKHELHVIVAPLPPEKQKKQSKKKLKHVAIP